MEGIILHFFISVISNMHSMEKSPYNFEIPRRSFASHSARAESEPPRHKDTKHSDVDITLNLIYYSSMNRLELLETFKVHAENAESALKEVAFEHMFADIRDSKEKTSKED